MAGMNGKKLPPLPAWVSWYDENRGWKIGVMFRTVERGPKYGHRMIIDVGPSLRKKIVPPDQVRIDNPGLYRTDPRAIVFAHENGLREGWYRLQAKFLKAWEENKKANLKS